MAAKSLSTDCSILILICVLWKFIEQRAFHVGPQQTTGLQNFVRWYCFVHRTREITQYLKYHHKELAQAHSSIFFFFFLAFQGRVQDIWKFPGWGLNRSYNRRPTPQPQQCRIQTESATCNTDPQPTERSQRWNLHLHGY